MDKIISYEWNSGSIPPPGYFEFSITIDPSGLGILKCQPDYAFNEPPVWSWTFNVSKTILDRLNKHLAAALTQTETSGTTGELNVGAHIEAITVQQAGQTISVPLTSEFISSIRSAVPDNIWAEMSSEREQYMSQSSQDTPPEGG